MSGSILKWRGMLKKRT